MLDYNLVTVRDISVVILAFKFGHFCVNKKSSKKHNIEKSVKYSILNVSQISTH